MTGGLQDQVTDGEKFYGVGLRPSSKAVIGSQEVPYIYEDRLDKDDFINGMMEMYELGPDGRAALGKECREWSLDRFGFDKFIQAWDNLFTSVHEKKGSWESRKGYTPYDVKVF